MCVLKEVAYFAIKSTKIRFSSRINIIYVQYPINCTVLYSRFVSWFVESNDSRSYIQYLQKASSMQISEMTICFTNYFGPTI